ncbi:hypothetical protein MtrunA17_Chr1g0169811 [Medicago truncatula]|uniref:Uncharacterized protein n=1 Tax=Medicago truncatula TaxID=3880 RepID=A0A396JN39_MEDTR|nr:hypothetical protein MtrunA17_Chr1g0169811 [Medicago truncatula]
MTLNDVSSLLHLPIKGMLVAHVGSVPRIEAIETMVQLMGADVDQAWYQLERTNGAYARFSWLNDIFKERLQKA